VIFDKAIKPEVFVSDDMTRPHLQHVYFNAAKGELAATNGHIMIVAPAGEHSLDDTGFIPVAALKHARKLARGNIEPPEIQLNGVALTRDGTAMPRPDRSADFPRYEHVMATSGPAKLSIGVSAKYLAAVFAACGDKVVTMHLGPGELDPIRVEAPSEYGTVHILIMPSKRL
jgi:hypothetical protein